MEREQIIKALECCIVNVWYNPKCNECPIYNGGASCVDELKEAILTLFNSQEQTIFELENRLKERENGYEGTLFLDRCKLHDAEEKVKELTEKNVRLQKANEYYSELEQGCYVTGVTKVISGTVTEIRDKLLARKVSYGNISFKVVPIDDIEAVCREMLEGGTDG